MKRKIRRPAESYQQVPTDLVVKRSSHGVRSKMLLATTSALLLLSVSVSGCGPTIPQLRTKASSDLSCPSSELELAHMKAGKMHVSGCGLEAIYEKSCQDDKECAWTQEKTGRKGDL